MDRDLKRSIILDNYQSPNNKHTSDDSYFKINTRNVSCIDNIDIYVKLEDDKITDIKYYGEACVIAISSSSILCKMLIGKTIEEAKKILDNYFRMIEEDEYDKEILGEAQVYDDIYKQPARKTCATLFARGMGKLFHKENS